MCSRRLLALLGGLVAILCVAFVVYALYVSAQQKKEIRDKFGSNVGSMCKAPGGGTADVANLTNKTAPLKFLVLTSSGMYHDWYKKLPAEIKATDKASLSAVVCLETSTKQIESCPYTDPKDTTKNLFTINRVQPITTMILLNPDTGARIAEVTIQGGMPDKCADTAKAKKGSTVTQSGASVTYNDFYTALTDFVKSTQGQ